MPGEDDEPRRAGWKGLLGGLLAAIVIVNGLMATVPDSLLRDDYGDVRGLFQLALAVIGVTSFAATWHWLDGLR